MNYTHDRNWGCRISDEHTFRGLRTLVLENELLRVTVLLDKGTDIYEFLYKPLDIDYMWRGPNPLRDPRAFVSTGEGQGGFFGDYYFGGWQEILPNGGVAVKYKGAALGQHGEVSIIPWNCRIVCDTPDEVTALTWTRTYRTPFLIEKKLTLKRNSAALFIEERLVNEGREPMEYMWGHHPAFGSPFLDDTCRIHVPAARVEVHPTHFSDNARLASGAVFESYPMVKDKTGAPVDLSRVPPPESEVCDMCYLLGLTDGWYALTSGRQNAGFGMRFDKEIFPVVWLWEVFGGNYGYPWYGRTYNLALEPWTSWPGGMDAARERGTLPTLASGAEVKTTLTAVAFEGKQEITGIDEQGRVS